MADSGSVPAEFPVLVVGDVEPAGEIHRLLSAGLPGRDVRLEVPESAALATVLDLAVRGF